MKVIIVKVPDMNSRNPKCKTCLGRGKYMRYIPREMKRTEEICGCVNWVPVGRARKKADEEAVVVVALLVLEYIFKVAAMGHKEHE